MNTSSTTLEVDPKARARLMRAVRWVPLVATTALLAQRSIAGVLGKLGHPGAALDDAYIHFQYARAFAEGHPFRFQAGEPISTGATSFLWPALLAPFYAIGFRDEAILWPAWLLSFAALGALAYEAYSLAKPLTGTLAAFGAGAMVLGFGGFAWGAASGMEVVPFAWIIASTTRRASEWSENEGVRTRPRYFILLALAAACPLMRPEGAITALAVALVLARFPRRNAFVVKGHDVSRIESLAFVGAALFPNLLLLLLTGRLTSSTANVKLLAGNPYYVVTDAASANARLLVGTILDGRVWSAEFLPAGGASVACAALVAIVVRGWSTKHAARSALVLLLALSMFVPCLYVTFLWNRLRYLWPFATGWIVGLACLARVIGSLASRIEPRSRSGTAAFVVGIFAGAFAIHLDGVLDDVSQSTSGIDRQQVALGRWARTHLPKDARIGVNDTGAIAYFSDRKTFDVVGLTTPSEGRFWVGGAGSRLEHYERLHKENPNALPSHFIVYPEWMGFESVFGRTLHAATVTDSTILGGQTMIVAEARWQHLGTGDRPWSPVGTIYDEVDVADLESERAHRYELFGAREGEQAVREGNAPSGAVVLDAGRTNRSREHFVVTLPTAGKTVGMMRIESDAVTSLRIAVNGNQASRVETREAGTWIEVTFDVPVDGPSDHVAVDVVADGTVFTSFHYWFAAP